MFGLLKRAVKGAVKGAIVLAVCTAGGGAYGYYRLAAGKIEAKDGAVVTTGICSTTPSISGGTLPVTFEAYVKDARAHNWLLTNRRIGLVKARYEWSHARFAWVEDTGFAERQGEGEAIRARKRLAAREVDALIRDLRSDDEVRREVSARELYVRTGQTLGYTYDGPRVEREQAAMAWERWWSEDRNRLKYGARRAIDRVDGALEDGRKALDTLRRAIGEEERK